jgi:P27 family predicted phage terminase small subunit
VGLRGPAPKPTAIKQAEGNPGKRRLNSNEPEFEATIPKVPSHIDKEAKKEWRRIAPMLLRNHVLTEADYMALANLCQAWATLKRLQSLLNDAPSLLVKTPAGYVQQTPLFSMIGKQMALVNRLCQEFGLTPSSRTRVKTEPGRSEEQDLMEILSRPRERRSQTDEPTELVQ